MLTRATKRVFVEVPEDFLDKRDRRTAIEDFVPLKELMSNLYELEEGVGFEIDHEWGCGEGTHSFVAKCVDAEDPFPDYRLKPDGTIELVEMGSDEETLKKLSDCLWPGGDKDNEWDSDTIDFVARTLIESGWGPKST